MDSLASRVGEVVGEKYRLVRLLGEGGMGSVYEARHDLIGRRFAVKFLHAELAGHPEILARFRREAQAAGSLENENIAAVTDFGSHQGAPYIVMEFLEGQDLAKVLAQTGPLSITRASQILIQVCRGLVAAHARGIVHRDLKPENLLLQTRGDGGDLVKILDFGIAKLKNNEHRPEAATRTGITLGTPYYMPPEQARGQKELDERADIYALGVILYELLSGRKPHNGENYNAILYSILMQAAPRIETFRPDLPPELAAVVHRAMAADANERYSSVSELGQALSSFAGRTLTPAPTISNASTAMAPQVHTPPPYTPLSNSTRAPVALTPALATMPPTRSRAPLFVTLGVAALGALGGGAWLVTRGGAPAPDPSAASAATAAPSGASYAPPTAPSIAPAPALPTLAEEAPAPAASSAAPVAAPPAPAPSPHQAVRGAAKPSPRQAKPAPAPPEPPVSKPAPARPAPAPKPDDDLFAP